MGSEINKRLQVRIFTCIRERGGVSYGRCQSNRAKYDTEPSRDRKERIMTAKERPGKLFLGGAIDPGTGKRTGEDVFYDSRNLTTHGIIVGMTGSGKTALGIVMLEEGKR
ncbi:MAG: hypothetical protein CG437_1238 [Methanosaeta sp. NSP1]|nr:MAG: hypothetical protein CG437_1238 [Methanosaeta sp. NSP1]